VPFGVGVEEMVRARVVLVHAPLDQAHAQHARVEIEVLLRRTGDRRDVMQTIDAVHGYLPAQRARVSHTPWWAAEALF
jgi:hypothetical protein